MSIPIPIKPIVYLHGEPTIRFEKKEVEVMIHHQELTLAIVGKFSHGWPDIAFLRNAIPKQCGLKAEVRIGLLCDRHVLIRCTIGEDFDTLMSRQTFEIKEKTRPYLMRTFKWDASFNPAEESRFAYGWISFPGLSPHYYGETTLFSLAAAVGSPIAIDAATLNKTRPSCARVKVEFDLLKSHPQHVVIQVGEGDGITTESQRIRYDFKPKYCTNCKLQGHDVNGCWNLKPELRPENFKAVDGGKEASAATIGKDGDEVEEKEMEVGEKELGEDASVDQPGQIIVQKKELSPIAIEAFFERVRTISEKKKKMFEKKEVEVMIHQQELNLAVIGKFSHGWPEIGLLRTLIPKQCGLKAEVNIGLLCDRHVLIRCTIAEDYDTLMSRQTFEIKEKNKPYLMRTFKWDVTFNPEEETRFAYGWISFPGFPPHFHGESSLFSMAASVGKPISIDSATRNKTRPSSARVKVEVDLLKVHPKSVLIQVGEGAEITSTQQRIRYDFLPKYCTNCKLQGHDSIGCWKLNPELRPNKENPAVARGDFRPSNFPKLLTNSGHSGRDGYGVASSRGHPTPRDHPPPVTYSNIVTNTHNVGGGNGLAKNSLGRNPSPSIPQKPISYLHGEPTIRFTNQEVASMVEQQDLKYAVVGKFSHGMPSIAFLRTAIPKQCSLKAEVNIGLLHNRHVLIRCSIEEDYVTLMSRPNFWIKESSKSFLMRTFKWDIGFTPEEETSMAVIWLSFPNLPPNFYVPSILFSIASAVGRPIAIDAATLNKTRPSCARVKVEADLLQEHPQRYNIQIMNGEEMETMSYKIRYDFLPKYCTTCMLQGHDLQGCWKEHPELQPEKRNHGEDSVVAAAKGKAPNPTLPPTNPSRQNPNPKPLPTAPNPPQEWTTVTHKRKKQNPQKQPLDLMENTTPATETTPQVVSDVGNIASSSKQPILTQILTEIGILPTETVIPASSAVGNTAPPPNQPISVETPTGNPTGNRPILPESGPNPNTAPINPNPIPGLGNPSLNPPNPEPKTAAPATQTTGNPVRNHPGNPPILPESPINPISAAPNPNPKPGLGHNCPTLPNSGSDPTLNPTPQNPTPEITHPGNTPPPKKSTRIRRKFSFAAVKP
ncbi:hypothetical protein RND71_015196 [Anisodus tanguticus]|uniref:DUF4283 domain-containing protein n=1 Tax=Anisodus tanguticus TaxID=243964 RepID=A0AAE1S584_9SOLA|nr:hypothetical protein RND71_015196 [Anisodus tanguticus]